MLSYLKIRWVKCPPKFIANVGGNLKKDNRNCNRFYKKREVKNERRIEKEELEGMLISREMKLKIWATPSLLTWCV